MRSVKSPRLSRAARAWLVASTRSATEVQLGTTLPYPEPPSVPLFVIIGLSREGVGNSIVYSLSPRPCPHSWHFEPSKAQRKKRNEYGYYVWEGTMRCPDCGSNHRDGEGPSRAENITIADRTFPTVCTISERLIQAELADVHRYLRECLPSCHVQDYIPTRAENIRWFMGCAIDLPETQPLQGEITWTERRRSYATFRRVEKAERPPLIPFEDDPEERRDDPRKEKWKYRKDAMARLAKELS